MRKIALSTIALLVVLSFAYAEIQAPAQAKEPVYFDIPQSTVRATSQYAPYYYFSREPISIMTSFYDYMIGSYNGLPLRAIPGEFGGGYFMVYQGRCDPDSTRKVYYTYLDQSGFVISNSEISDSSATEGYPTMTIDPVSGKPMYAWHTDVDHDGKQEVVFAADAFMDDFPGLFTNYQTIVDNPTQITAPNGVVTGDNQFIWPTATIGPSPIAGKRRVYVATRNSRSHVPNNFPSENVLIAYADIDGDMIEEGIPAVWNYTSVPTFDLWNVDTENWRRPFTTFCADDAGNIYYIGYHDSRDLDGNPFDEPDVHVMKCDNFGEGTWTMMTASGHIPAWIPEGPPWVEPHFYDEDGNPYEPGELYWAIQNSSHVNAVVDRSGRIHFPALWALSSDTSYYPNMQYVKQLIFDPATNEVSIHEVYPIKHPDNTADYECYHPWDNEPPWGEAEYIQVDGEWHLDINAMWPFCHWDRTAHESSMMAHYNNIKMSKPNQHSWTVMVWQDCNRAMLYDQSDDPGAGFSPDIMIAVSPNNGMTWKDPICLNSLDVPQLADLTPMWVYPVDEVVYAGVAHNPKEGRDYHMGKVGLMFYDDNTWGSYELYPPYHDNNDGGEVMFMELTIAFEPAGDADESLASAPGIDILKGNFPNPFNPETTISYTMPAAGDAKLGIYNLRGQLVRSLVNEPKAGGDHRVVWDGKDDNGDSVTSGIYFYRLETGKHSQTRKMMLMQ